MAKIASAPDAQPTHDEIAARACALYEQSGCIEGCDLQNWLQAETELKAARNSAATKAAAPKPAPSRTPSKPANSKTPGAPTYA